MSSRVWRDVVTRSLGSQQIQGQDGVKLSPVDVHDGILIRR